MAALLSWTIETLGGVVILGVVLTVWKPGNPQLQNLITEMQTGLVIAAGLAAAS